MAEPLREPDASDEPTFLHFGNKSAPSPAPVPKDPTVAEVIRAYLEEIELEHKAGALAEATLKTATFYLNSFAAMFGEQRISESRKRDITAWIVAHPEWVSPHTKIDASASVVRCFRWADEEDLIDRVPFRRPRRLWQPPEPREPITPAELDAIMRVAKESNGMIRPCRPGRTAFRLAMWFLWETGARTCEMREARFADVDWKRHVIALAKHKTARATGQSRLIPLSYPAWRLIRWLYRRRRPEQEHIFITVRGRPWSKSSFVSLFRRFARLAGVRDEVSGYSLRHGFTVKGLEAGVGERQLADALGHTSTKYIAWYGRRTRARARYLRDVLHQVHGHPDAPPDEQVGDDEPPAPLLAAAPPDPPRSNAGAQAMRDEAARRYAGILPTIKAMREGGATFQAIADRLNADGAVTLHGKPWSASRIRQVLEQGRAQPRETPYKDLEALEAYKDVLPIMKSMRAAGATYLAIAEELNRKGLATRRGHEWTLSQVWLVLARASKEPAPADPGRTLPADVVLIARDLQQQGKTLEELVAELASAGCKTPTGKAWTVARVRRLLKDAGATALKVTGVNKARQEEANQHYAAILPDMLKLQAAGMSNGEIAGQLNAQGLRTREGAAWNRWRVRELLARHRGPTA